jgi:hypothetical protein
MERVGSAPRSQVWFGANSEEYGPIHRRRQRYRQWSINFPSAECRTAGPEFTSVIDARTCDAVRTPRWQRGRSYTGIFVHNRRLTRLAARQFAVVRYPLPMSDHSIVTPPGSARAAAAASNAGADFAPRSIIEPGPTNEQRGPLKCAAAPRASRVFCACAHRPPE